MEPPVAVSDRMHHSNDSDYFTPDEEMIDSGSIFSGPAVSGSDPEAIGPFSDSFITEKVLIWDKMVEFIKYTLSCDRLFSIDSYNPYISLSL